MFLIRMMMLSVMLLMIFGLSACSCGRLAGVHMVIQADPYINPNIYAKAAPVELNFYTLKTPTYFKQAHFDALEHSATMILHDSLVSQKAVEIRPNQRLFYTLHLPASAHFIGITAGFREWQHATWRLVLHRLVLKQKWYQRLFHRVMTLRVVVHTQQISAYMSWK